MRWNINLNYTPSIYPSIWMRIITVKTISNRIRVTIIIINWKYLSTNVYRIVHNTLHTTQNDIMGNMCFALLHFHIKIERFFYLCNSIPLCVSVYACSSFFNLLFSSFFHYYYCAHCSAFQSLCSNEWITLERNW